MSSRHRIVAGKLRHVQGWRAGYPRLPDPRVEAMTASAWFVSAASMAETDLSPWCPAVRDQGSIGSCTAESAVTCMGFLYKKAGLPDPKMSALFLYWWTRYLEGTPATEDSGADPMDALKAMEVYGACLESTWPYRDDSVTYTRKPPSVATEEAKNHQALFAYPCPTLYTIKASLAQGFPVSLGFTCYEDALFGPGVSDTGIIPFPMPSDAVVGGHDIVVVGNSDKKGWLKIQNSWGTDWGDGGFGYLDHQYVTDGLTAGGYTLRREEM